MPGRHEAPSGSSGSLEVVQAQVDEVLSLHLDEMTAAVRSIIETRLAKKALDIHLDNK